MDKRDADRINSVLTEVLRRQGLQDNRILAQEKTIQQLFQRIVDLEKQNSRLIANTSMG